MKDHQFIYRVLEVLKLCDQGKITDEQGIKKLMRSSAKLIQSRFKDLQSVQIANLCKNCGREDANLQEPLNFSNDVFCSTICIDEYIETQKKVKT